MEKKAYKNYCHSCGVELTPENSRFDNATHCVECESKSFIELERQNGTHLALYFNCLKFDVPLFPLLLPTNFNEQENKWEFYLELLEENEKVYSGEKLLTFEDGETILLRIFGKEFSEKDFARFVRSERERIERLVGTEKQREFWGERPLWQKLPMTNELYNELDRRYEAKKARYKGITLDEVLVDTLKKLCKLEAAQDYLQSIGDAASFDKVQKSINSINEAEQLRKKDEKPVEALRLDSLVLALEDAGLMESGDLLSYDELLDVMRDHFVKSKKYDYSLDVADQVLLDIINSMRANADEAAVIDLPKELELVDEYGEFEPEETESEKENKKYLGLTKVQFVDKEE